MPYSEKDIVKFIKHLNSKGILINHPKLKADFDYANRVIDDFMSDSHAIFGEKRIHYGVYEFDKYRLPDRFFDGLEFKNNNKEMQFYCFYKENK